ncbi:MAG: CPBP family intramembrane metalloprotease [Clostridia bacterium]|nr:CPBP family intramembrane metalloprotease [Clostridia bacterium]
MNDCKKDAARVSKVLGYASLFSMILGFALSLAAEKYPILKTDYVLVFRTALLAVFILPSVWSVWTFRRLGIGFPNVPPRAYLNKKLAVMLSTFGLIEIIRIFYVSVFPSSVIRAGVYDGMTATELFFLFLFATAATAAAEEIFFRGLFLRSMRIFRSSLAVLMSALVFGLMHFSVAGFPFYFVAGLLIGMAYVATNSLATVIGISFLCKSFVFLEETVSVFMPDAYLLLMQGALAVCVLLSASGLPYLRENMRAFFEDDDEKAISSFCFWTVPTVLFFVLAAGIQILL